MYCIKISIEEKYRHSCRCNVDIQLTASKQHNAEHKLTSHGAESITLLSVIVVSCTTPSHAITAPVCGAVSVVAAAIEEGKVAQSAIGVATSCYHHGWY